MKLLHWMKKEDSGLARSTLEIAKYEDRAGHIVQIRQPGDDRPLYGPPVTPDLHLVHSQISAETYHDGVPKLMWMHGEPLGSVGNGISMKAIVDLAPMVEAFICMRRDELAVWNSIKKTYLVTKGVDLEAYRPLGPTEVERLPGEPAVLYYENWRGQRNPLYLCVAMQIVRKSLPNARLHLYNCRDKRMLETFKSLLANNKWWTFIRSLQGRVEDVNKLLNQVDIVASGLHPLYARGVEAFAAGKAYIGPGYREPGYPFTCELQPEDMARCIIECWENYGKVDYRKWAEERHNAQDTAAQAIEIYERYAGESQGGPFAAVVA